MITADHHLTVNSWSLLAIIWQSTLDHYWPSSDSQHLITTGHHLTVNTWSLLAIINSQHLITTGHQLTVNTWSLLAIIWQSTLDHYWPSSDSQHLITTGHRLTVNTWSLLAIIWQSTLDHYWPSSDSQHLITTGHHLTVNTWSLLAIIWQSTLDHCWPSSDSQHLITHCYIWRSPLYMFTRSRIKTTTLELHGIYYISCMNYDIYFLIQLFRPLYLRFNQNVSFHTCISPTIPARPCRDSRWTLAVFPLVQVWYTVNSSLFSFPVFC